MRIGVVTVYDSMNYGSFLQAYALKTFLQDEGHEVLFIKWNNDRNKAWKKIMKSTILTRGVSIRGIKAGIGRIKSFTGVKDNFSEIEDIKNLDLIVVGSDTLWDVARLYFRNKVFYGFFESDIPTISYAVSCSDSTESDFNNYISITNNIKKFMYVTVRDMHTKEVIKNSLGLDATLVCDPTLLIAEDKWKINKIDTDLSSTLLVYAYVLPKDIISHLKRYCQENSLRLTSLCVFHSWCDSHINCTPLEFPSYLKAAKNVVTNTFHGTIFSIISESNIISVKNGEKLSNLLKEFFDNDISLDKNCNYEEFIEKASRKIEYTYCKERIADSRERSCRTFLEILGTDYLNKKRTSD